MSKIDPEQERQRLNKLYSGMSDGELESLGRDQGELTEWARDTLRAAMLVRGLEWREDPVGGRAELPTDANLLLVLRSYADVAKAAVDRAKLKQAGIEAHFFGAPAPGSPGLVTWVASDGVWLLVCAAALAKSMELLGPEEQAEGAESGNAATLGGARERDGKPAILRVYRNITEAMVDRTALESAGIECFLYDDNLIRLDWFVSDAVGGAKLVVSHKDAAEARKILGETRPLGD